MARCVGDVITVVCNSSSGPSTSESKHQLTQLTQKHLLPVQYSCLSDHTRSLSVTRTVFSLPNTGLLHCWGEEMPRPARPLHRRRQQLWRSALDAKERLHKEGKLFNRVKTGMLHKPALQPPPSGEGLQ